MAAKTQIVQEQPAEDLVGHNGGPPMGEKDPCYISVITRVNGKDVIVDTRVCDIYDFEARKWLNKHIFWAICQGHEIVQHPATADEVQSYTAKQAQLLSRRYGK